MTTPEVGQGQAYPANTRVKLLKDVDGIKEIDGKSFDHRLPAGTIALIRQGMPVNPRSSSNTHPISAADFMYKLTATIVENVREQRLEGPYDGHRDEQKIRHAALDTNRCPPKSRDGIYRVNEMSYIRPEYQYTYPRRSGAVTIKGGDLILFNDSGKTKMGGPVTISNNAWYRSVSKVTYVVVEKKFIWKSDFAVSPGTWFEIVN